MKTIEQKKAQRFLYLKRLYEKAEGNTFPDFIFTDIGREFGWDDQTSDEVTEYLKNEGLVEFISSANVKLTHRGLKLMEEALSSPTQPTPYFPPANIIIVVNGNFTVQGSIIGRDQTITNSANNDNENR